MPLSAKLVGNIYYNVTLGRCGGGASQNWGAVQTRHLPARSLAPPAPAGSSDSLCRGPNRPDRVLSVCLRTDSHTQPPRQTYGGQAAALAWGLATPRAMRVSVRCGVRCLSANKLKRTSHLLSSSRGHRTRRPLCSDRQGLLKGGDVWVQVC